MSRASPSSSPGPSRASVAVALLLVQFLFATHYVVAKEVVGAMPPRVWAAIRAVGAGALLLSLTLLRRQRWPTDPGTLLRFAGFALLGVVINQVCFVEGLSRTTPVQSSLINCTIPVLTLAMAVAVGQERVRASAIAGIVLALAGVAVLLRVEAFDLRDTLVQGNLLTVVNAASFSAFLVVSKPTLSRVGTLPAASLLFLLGAPWIALLALPELRAFEPATIAPSIWALGAYIIVFPTVVTYLLNYWSLRRAPSSLVALFIYAQAPMAALLWLAWAGRAPGARDYLAFLLVAAGIGVAVFRPGRRAGRAA